MKKLSILNLLPIFISVLSGCTDDEPALLSEIKGTWTIESINYQMCQDGDCQDNPMDFGDSGLTFEIRKDSVFYYPFVDSPELINRFALHSVAGSTLKLRNDAGIWDYVIDDKGENALTVRAIVPTISPDIVYYDIVSLSR